ncbi:tetratricopeptide repeat protein [Streptomyces sp. NPDC004284]|uniref:tetratricopeptide repeat protein n=1 Tax=Streptomyces sp. NPDC004284 TaxID=3364695 RepID=UPI00369BC395
MDAPVGPQEGVGYIQIITATAGGRVNAVQHGDQYNYIYRGTPPYRVEPFPLTAPAAAPAALARVPSRLLTARHQIVPFIPRPELALLEAWRDGEPPGLSVRLVHAEGGTGKTRLAAEFAARSAGAGWAVALARHRSEAASAGDGDQTLTVRAPGLVLIVDYAERWPLEDLITLVRQHRDAARDKLRVLLLARPTGTWWQGLAHQFTKLDILDVDALRLEGLPDTPGVRAEMYVAARDRFAEIFAHTHSAGIGVPDHLDDPVFALTLTVHMRALVDVDAASRGKTPPTSSGQASLSSYLLDREHDHWRSFHDQGRGPLRATERTMGRAVYVATLTGALPPADASAALTRAGAADTPAAGGQLAEDHTRCYPPTEPGLVLDPLSPDRLGEDYLALTLPGHEDEFDYHATDPWTLTTPAALLAPDHRNSGPSPYTRQALSVMIEAAHRWPHLTTQHLNPLLRHHPELVLAAGSAALTRLADLTTLDIGVLEIIEPHFPEIRHTDLDIGVAALAARLAHHRLAATRDPATRAGIHVTLSLRQHLAGLHNEALTNAQQAVQASRDITPAHPGHEPVLATSLSSLGSLLAEVGRMGEALPPTEEAVGIRRRLAAANPAVHEPYLAVSLSELGNRLAEVGRRGEALAAEQEAVGIRRRLAADNPAVYEPHLAISLGNLGNWLAEVGRVGEALPPTEQAVEIYRRQAVDNPAAHEPPLAHLLSALGNRLAEVGRAGEALAAEQEAVEIRRRLAAANPSAHEPLLAHSLSALGNRLAEVGRRGEALTAAEQAVEIHRRLAADNPAVHEPRLAASLGNLGNSLAEVGRAGEALTATEQAFAIYHRLAADNPAVHEPHVAHSLSHLGSLLAEVGRVGEALAAEQAAVEIRRRLAADNPAVHEPDLATSLSHLGSLLAEVGRAGEALTPTEQAFAIRRRLAADNPAVHERHLAHSLSDLSSLLAEVGRVGEALAAEEAAVEIRRRLAADNPAVHEPDLATSLSNLGVRLAEVGRRGEALPLTEQAVEIHRRLAAGNPIVHEPRLATSLSNLRAFLAGIGHVDEALTAEQEAVEIRRRLAADNPAVHEPDLAFSLSKLGGVLVEVGRGSEALAPLEQAVEIYRRLAAGDPVAQEPLAESLSFWAWVRYAAQEDLSGALRAAGEAVEIYRRLVAAVPERFLSPLCGVLDLQADLLAGLGRLGEAQAIRAWLAANAPDRNA